MEKTVFNKAQLEILDIMAGIRSDEEFDALRHAISEFYAKRADEEMEKLWQSGKWNEQTLKELEIAMANVKFGYTPTHPGEVFKEEIEYRKISQRKLAEQMGMSYKALNDLLNGHRSLTVSTAMMFEAALDVPADSLMRLQLKYNMQKTASDKSFMERLSQIRKYAALL